MVTRWWVVLCAAVIWDTVSLHPDNGRSTECCPCPKDASASASSLAPDALAADQTADGTAVSRAAGALGECPCRLRAADSEGAPSVFFPAAMRAVRPFVNLEDSKENPDPLLHPEVNLASSFLETLREATDEEYRDALARDAARSAADGETAESARNLVTVLINPKDAVSDDDVMAEASHVHEARCISPPLGRSSFKTAYKPVSLTDILNLPKKSSRSWNLFDLDNGVGASNVNERVVKPDFKENEVAYKSASDISNDKLLGSLEKLKLNLPKLNLNKERSSFKAHTVFPKYKTPTKIELPSISNILPKLNSPKLLRRQQDDESSIAADSQNAPSIFKERYTGFGRENNKDDDIMITRPIQTTERPRTANRIEFPKFPDLLPKIKASNLLRNNENEDQSIGFDSRNAANEQKECLTTLTTDNSKSQEVMVEKPTSATSNFRISKPLSKLMPKINTPNLLRRNEAEDFSTNSDNQNAASIIKERYTGFAKDSKDDDTTITKSVQTTSRPNFKSSGNFGANSISNSLKDKSGGRDATTDLLSNLLRGLEVPNLGNLFSTDLFSLRNNDQSTKSTEQKTTPDNKPFTTEILDAVPSPSEIKSDHISFEEVEQASGVNNNINKENEEIDKVIEQNPMKTEIIDHVPNSSDINEFPDENTNVLTDPDVKAKVNTITNSENSELNNEMELLNNEDIIEDTIISELDRDSQVENAEINASNNIVEIDAPQMTNFETPLSNDYEIDEFIDDSNLDHNKPLPLRERIKNRLDDFKKRNKATQNLQNFDKSKSQLNNNFAMANDPQITSNSQSEETGLLHTQILDNVPSTENTNKVDIEDLQHMSDSLLDKEKLRVESATENNIDQNIKNDREDELEIDDILENDDQDLLIEDKGGSAIDNSMLASDNLNSITITNNDGKTFECMEKNTLAKSALPNAKLESNNENSEMASEASERVFNNVESPLRQSIVQPPSLNDLNLLNLPTLEISDVININNPIPALKLTDIFNSRKNFDELSSTRNDILDLDKKLNMSPSTSSFRSALPSLQPVEDINLDILQLKPLGAELPSIPRLNLNSFKTKLTVPESLQLRPLILESSVRNNKGVVGTSLTFGNDDTKGRSNMLGQASLKKPTILGRSLGELPSLDDWRSTMLENAHNLFNTPLETTSRNVVEDTLRSGQVLTENLRVEAENTVKDFQRNLESTFKNVGLNSNGFLASPSLKSPNDFFEEISRKHEDVNDKLKGIGYDLSDRLETLRNNLFDDYRIPSIRSNILDRMQSLGSPMPKQSSFMKPKAKSSTYSSKGKKVTLGSDSGTKGRFISRSKTDKNKLKMPTAASVANLKSVKSPSFKSADYPILKGLGKESRTKELFARERPTLSLLQKPEKNIIDTRRSFLKKPSLPKLSKNKVTISFSTTPSTPISMNRPRFKDLTKPKSVSTKGPITLPTLSKSVKERPRLLSSFRDSNGFASEPVSSRVKAPFKSIKDLKSILPKTATLEKDDEEFTVYNSSPKPLIDPPGLIKPKPPTLNKMYTTNSEHLTSDGSLKPKSPLVPSGTINNVTTQKLGAPHRIAPLSWPKTVDDTFLTKVREALRARIAGLSQDLNSKANARKSNVNSLVSDKSKSPEDVDMARSASNNIDVTDLEPKVLKENTSYSCKMMCTKN